ncbi:MAG: murein biosynthesis integral membrane protein MurJ [Actinomycetota bacterium]
MSAIGEAGETPLDVVGDPLAGAGDRNRAAARMGAVTLLSRGNGFVRVLVVAAVLGATYLGNTYQSANSVPTVLFELVVAGALQAVLVPVLISESDRRRQDEAASAVLGATTAALAALGVLAMVAAPLVARVLFAAVDDPVIRDQQIHLGTVLLWCFLPQIVFYGISLVGTSTLHARGRFSLPAFAPFVNNVVVIGVYLLFAWQRGGASPSLDLTSGEVLLLGIGTTLGVVAFCALPMFGARRIGVDLRWRWQPRHPAVRRVVRDGSWAGAFMASSQVVLLGVLVLANSVEGGVIVQQLAYVCFLLPISILVIPVITTAFPKLSGDADRGDWSEYRREVVRTGRIVLAASVLSAVVLALLRHPLAQVVSLGNASVATDQVAVAIAGFAVGLPGFAAVLLLTRASYARRETRSPALVAGAVAVVALVAMAVTASQAPIDVRIGAIGVAHGAAWTLGALVLATALLADLRRQREAVT